MNCRILGCHNKVRARGICSTHHNRLRKNGKLKKLVFGGSCKDCGEVKPRIKSERRKSKTSFHYVDQDGRLWNGYVCPDCKNPKLLVKCEKRKNFEESVDDEFIYC